MLQCFGSRWCGTECIVVTDRGWLDCGIYLTAGLVVVVVVEAAAVVWCFILPDTCLVLYEC